MQKVPEKSAGVPATVIELHSLCTGLFRSFLASRLLPLTLSVAAVLLCLPALGTGWQVDDLIHRWILSGPRDFGGLEWSRNSIFAFIDGNPVRTRALMDLGLVPWWTLPELTLSFWRPLATAAHRLDYLLWPDSAPLMHLHSLLWLGAMTAAAVLLYRRLGAAPMAAGLAALLFAVDDAHGGPAAWIANRNALMGAAFGLTALIAHVDGAKGGRGSARAAPVIYLCGLLSAEAALGALAYLVSFALVIDGRNIRRRMLSLAPYLLVTALWHLAYSLQGYGAHGSGWYIHPLGEPLRFAAALVERAPILLFGQWGWPPSDIWVFLSPRGKTIYWLTAVAFLAALAAMMHLLLRRSPTARFWGLGMVLSVLPACATVPQDRLLLFTGLGAMGILGEALTSFSLRGSPHGKILRHTIAAFLFLLVVVHGVAGPLSLPGRAAAISGAEPYVQGAFEDLPPAADLEGRTVVFVNPPIPYFAGFFPIVRSLEGKSIGRSHLVLAPGMTSTSIRRIDEKTMAVRPTGGFLSAPLDVLFREKAHSFMPGERVSLAGVRIDVVELTDDGRPAEASFRFESALEDPSILWLHWDRGSFAAWEPPAEGSSAELAGYP